MSPPPDLRGPKPLLRGWLHVVAAVASVPFAVLLVVASWDDPPRLASVLVYGLCTVSLYVGSAAYHIHTNSTRHSELLWRIDLTNIHLMIAGTATPIAVNVLAGWERVLVMGMNWGVALTGILLSVLSSRWPPWGRAVLFIGAGLSNVLAMPGLAARLPPAPVLLLLLGGALYVVGAVVYGLGRPNPSPRLFGYHEVFHVFVVAAGLSFAVAIWVWVLPFPRA
jgi:hemolysin III